MCSKSKGGRRATSAPRSPRPDGADDDDVLVGEFCHTVGPASMSDNPECARRFVVLHFTRQFTEPNGTVDHAAFFLLRGRPLQSAYGSAKDKLQLALETCTQL